VGKGWRSVAGRGLGDNGRLPGGVLAERGRRVKKKYKSLAQLSNKKNREMPEQYGRKQALKN